MDKSIPLYFLLPSEEYPDKLVKMQGSTVKVSWKCHDEIHDDIVAKETFVKNKAGMLREINKQEYDYRYSELFPQYVSEENMKQ